MNKQTLRGGEMRFTRMRDYELLKSIIVFDRRSFGAIPDELFYGLTVRALKLGFFFDLLPRLVTVDIRFTNATRLFG